MLSVTHLRLRKSLANCEHAMGSRLSRNLMVRMSFPRKREPMLSWLNYGLRDFTLSMDSRFRGNDVLKVPGQ
jgi:hypothetical protein